MKSTIKNVTIHILGVDIELKCGKILSRIKCDSKRRAASATNTDGPHSQKGPDLSMNTNSLPHPTRPAPVNPLTLYVPTSAEIAHVCESAERRWPALASRINKARDILLNGSLTVDPVAWEVRNVAHWRIASQTHAAGAYIIVGLHCPCRDSRAPMICNGRFCKHNMAVANYLKILRNHLNADIRNREIDLGILPNGEFHCYAKGIGYVQACRSGATYDFVGAASVVHYSLWLARREKSRRPVATFPANVLAVAA
jgi:hypothetical protein